jgi:predicted lipoprotein with Yx(FWY)xxD motif
MSNQDGSRGGKRGAARVPPSTPADINMFEEKGEYIVRDNDGFAVYRYDRDADGQSHCAGACSQEWPPLPAPAGANAVEGWSVIQRADKTRQWAYRGQPLYTRAKDTPGGAEGDGLGGVWHLLKL